MSLRHRAGYLGLGSAEDRLLTLPPPSGGDLPNWRASLGGSKLVGHPRGVIVVAEYIILFIIIVFGPLDVGKLHVCQQSL